MNGSLPLALLALLGGSHIAASRAFAPPRPGRDRVIASAVIAPAMIVLIVRSLGAVGLLTPVSVLLATLAVALGLAAAGGSGARGIALGDLRAAIRVVRTAFAGGSWSLGAWVGAGAVLLAAWSAWLLEPWAWDALGYHLPIVHDALQTARIRVVPTGVPYINSYPRAVDLTFVWWRLLLGGDRWVDFAQAPCALAGIAAIAAMASRAGVGAARAVAVAMLFASIPVVALELATNYVDVAYGALLLVCVYLVTGATAWADAVVTGVAMGLLLAAKPSAPPVVAALGVTFLVRATRAGVARRALIAGLIALAIGVEQYVINIVEHHNPLWPVDIHVGSLLHFEGTEPSGYFFNVGVPEPYRHYGWVRRVIGSWFAHDVRYIYDMRIGGLGPLFSFGLLPIAIASLWQKRFRAIALPVVLVTCCTLATPGAFWARYTLALPGALLALAAVASESLSDRVRRAWDIAAAGLAVWGLAIAIGGFTDNGPSLLALSRMSAVERSIAVSIDGHEPDWMHARSLVGPGEAFGYDHGFGLPGQLWRSDGRGRVTYIPDAIRGIDELIELVRSERIRVIALSDAPFGAGPAAVSRPDRFVPLFRCPLDQCTVFRVAR